MSRRTRNMVQPPPGREKPDPRRNHAPLPRPPLHRPLARLDRADHAEHDEIARGAVPAPQVRVAVLGGHLVDEAVRAPRQDLREVSRLADLDAIAALAVWVGPRLPAREVEDAAAQGGEQAQVAAEGVEARLRIPLALDLR